MKPFSDDVRCCHIQFVERAVCRMLEGGEEQDKFMIFVFINLIKSFRSHKQASLNNGRSVSQSTLIQLKCAALSFQLCKIFLEILR